MLQWKVKRRRMIQTECMYAGNNNGVNGVAESKIKYNKNRVKTTLQYTVYFFQRNGPWIKYYTAHRGKKDTSVTRFRFIYYKRLIYGKRSENDSQSSCLQSDFHLYYRNTYYFSTHVIRLYVYLACTNCATFCCITRCTNNHHSPEPLCMIDNNNVSPYARLFV